MFSLGYIELLLIASAALVLASVLILWRRRDTSRLSNLEKALSAAPEDVPQEVLERVLPLLLLEERFPAFGEIVALVISRHGLMKVAGRENFTEPADYLANATFSDRPGGSVRGALCHMVRGFLDDPDIEYQCRPELSELVDRFIDEVHRDESSGG